MTPRPAPRPAIRIASEIAATLALVAVTTFTVHNRLAFASGASPAQLQSASATPLLLVVNQGDKNISLIDPVAQKQIATISEDVTDVHGHEIAASPDGRFAYIPIYGSSGVGQPGI